MRRFAFFALLLLAGSLTAQTPLDRAALQGLAPAPVLSKCLRVNGDGYIYAAAGDCPDGDTTGGSPCDAWPVGSIFISVSATNPGISLGCGTWAAFGAGRVLVGVDAGQAEFDTVEEAGGAKTHTLTVAEMPAHTHDEFNNSSTTGGNIGWGAQDTSTNSASLTGYDTGATGGGGAHNNLQPYLTVFFHKRVS